MRKMFILAVAAAVVVTAAGIVGAGQEAAAPVVTVYVEGSTVSSFSGSGNAWGGGIAGTTEPQTIEVMKQMERFCRDVEITANRDTAQFLILHERQSGGTWGGNRNNIALFGKDDMLIYADGATKLDNAVKDLCRSGLLAQESAPAQ